MKKVLDLGLVAILLAMLALAGCGDADDPVGALDIPEVEGSAEDMAQMSSGTINWLIYSEAMQYSGQYVGLNCKNWVKKIVSDAVGVPLPSTASGDGSWNPSPYTLVVWSGNSAPGYFPTWSLSRGQIIQMNWDGKPHTAIIKFVTRTRIYVVHSNWDPPYGLTVSEDVFTLSWWQSHVRSWTVYQITK